MNLKKIITATQLFNDLKSINWSLTYEFITFTLNNINVIIDTTDTVGVTLQSWLKQYFLANNIYFRENSNSQEFPDFYLGNCNNSNLLEIKAFNYCKTPAFDIANFDSYCDLVIEKPYILDTDYLIFGYNMDINGKITIIDIWLKKIWEIAGKSEKYPLKVQEKRGVIYNIRPNTNFKKYDQTPFNSKEDFIKAIYDTIFIYKDKDIAKEWYDKLHNNLQP